MRQPTLSKTELVQLLMREFRCLGFDGLSMTQISEATRLGRASLYHHFPGGKEEMAQSVTKAALEWVQKEIIGILTTDKPPLERLRAVLAKLDVFYQSGQIPCILEVMSTSNTPKAVRESVKLTLTHLLKGFEELGIEFGLSAKDAKLAAENTMVSIQGALVLSRCLKSNDPFRRQMKAIEGAYEKLASVNFR